MKATSSHVSRDALCRLTRRETLARCANGFGMIALAGLLREDARAAEAPALLNPLAAKLPHYLARAKRAIFLFMSGGPSHVDTFDPKPRLSQDDGKPLPFEKPMLM